MSQPQFNPYNQAPIPPQAPLPQQPPGFGPPPGYPGPAPGYPGPPPVQPGPPYPFHPAPSGAAPRTGSSVGAFFLGLLGSFLVSALYIGVVVATYQHQSENARHTLYLAHALINGAVVGLLSGLVGRRRTGARICAAVVAPLGAFFGYTNSVVMVFAYSGGYHAVEHMLKFVPILPARSWWGSQSGSEWVAVLGLLLAAGTAWTLTYLVGRRRR
ncbi:hypothetical protein [Kitasatospora sp. NPDC002040]|uniref:hypothetical protein n=1 Tax=Kitasatospora sp. NPDC002040 TaxID=3154661 RepID=UPI00331C4235